MISEDIALTATELGVEGEKILLLQHICGSQHRVNLEWGLFV